MVTRLCDMMQHIWVALHCRRARGPAYPMAWCRVLSPAATPYMPTELQGPAAQSCFDCWWTADHLRQCLASLCRFLCLSCFMLSSDLNVQLTGADRWCAV